ncbi:TerC family protein [Blattabacterium cuenoti]|uniref:TerC family protein n=1 Tax=Blattabacterium cuenoti TaxID=1653831 RepID=UPI00163CB640|nr:DUF475 domain-containing protein [Blattabacterium cuenoti]
MIKFIQEILNHPFLSISIIINLFIIESILSIDNAIILSSMIIELDREKDRKIAMIYGFTVAYIFRILCLFFTSILINVQWLKLLGGGYLMVNGVINYYNNNKNINLIKRKKKKIFSWKTVLSIGLMDLIFSIDNIFASIALSKNLLLILFGVFIGILSIRISTKFFIKIIKKVPELTSSVSIIIILLGLKLFISYFKESFFGGYKEYIFILLILIIITLPFLFKKKS